MTMRLMGGHIVRTSIINQASPDFYPIIQRHTIDGGHLTLAHQDRSGSVRMNFKEVLESNEKKNNQRK